MGYFKRENEGYTGQQLRAALQEPAQRLFAKFKRKYLLPRYGALRVTKREGDRYEQPHNVTLADAAEQWHQDDYSQDQLKAEYGGENHQQVDHDYEHSRYNQESNPWTNEQVPWEPMPSSRTETRSPEGYRAKREAANNPLKPYLKKSPTAEHRRSPRVAPGHMMTMLPM